MTKNIIAMIVVLVVIIALGVAYYFISPIVSTNNSVVQNSVQTQKKVEQVKTPSRDEQLAQLRKDYPETITGIINLLDTKTVIKSTVKADDGKVYIFSPAQPKFIYEGFGVKDGQKVEVWVKSTSQINIEWGNIKPI